MTLGTLFDQIESSFSKDHSYQISMHFCQWFMRRRFLNIYQNFLILPVLDLKKS